MMHKISVILADSSEDFLEQMSEDINKEDDMSVVATADDGEKALSLAKTLRPQVLVTDVLLRRLDGLGVMRELKRGGCMPQTIVLSAFFNDIIAAEISSLGASYCFQKPCRTCELINRIRECVHDEPAEPTVTSYEAEIAEALINFGIMPHLQGYRYLREAIGRTLIDRDALRGVTKIMYPDLAKAYHTTSKCVERSMRNAVDAAWKHGDARRRNGYFGEMTMLLTSRPTNSRFISMMAEFILLRQPHERREELAGRV